MLNRVERMNRMDGCWVRQLVLPYGLFLCFLLAGFRGDAQQQRFWNWYFGNRAGVSFATGSPVALTDGQLVTTEGCATISDGSGNLLFYTDGVSVWNRNHVVMTNGTGLMGHASSTQSAIIVQRPGSNNNYYIFTADADAGPNGIRYTEVNMALSGGLGAVTANKNVPLYTPSCEKITAVRHCNNRDIWIVSHDWNSNGFRSWLITPAGISTTPVLSNSGAVIAGIYQSKYGQLKTNPDGNKLLTAAYGYTGSGTNKFELHDFNNSTGVVSGGILLADEVGAYGCEFSPNGRIAYGATNGGRLVQFNLCAGNTAAIQASKVVIGVLGPFIGSLQLGPDGKIYVSRNSTSLSVINNPNVLGTGCNYANAAIPLGRNSGMGLPNMAAFYMRPEITPYTYTANCLNVNFTAPSVNVSTNSCAGAGSAIQGSAWNFGDPASGAANTSTQLNPTHTFSTVGTYQVRLILNLGCYYDTIIQSINITGFNLNLSSLPAGCGLSNGSASAVPAVAGTYTWLWSNGATTQTATGLAAGTYSVTVTSNTGCSATGSVTVGGGGSLSASVSTIPASCYGTATGSATATASGGTGPYTYSWSNGATGPTASGLAQGNYSVTVTDAGSCTSTHNFTINQPAQLIATASAGTVACSGGTGSASVTAGGGTLPYSYLWSNGSITPAISGIANGNYTVTVTDANGCQATRAVTVNQPPALTATATASPATCTGGNGSATVNVNGGTAPYTYLWSNGATTATATGLPNGNYSVTVNDANGCSLIRSVTVNQPAALVLNTSFTPSICGASNGSVSVAVTGGTAPYSYSWNTSPVQTTATAGNLPAGSYTVQVQDAAGCTRTASVAIPNSGGLSVNASVIAHASCNGGNNGSVTATASGGTAPYTWSWSNGATTASVSNLAAGSYTVTAQDANGCTAGQTITINQPASLSLSTSFTPSVCGSANGSVSVVVTGGTAAYSYNWNTSPVQTTATANNLPAGTYTVQVQDAAGCTQTASATIPNTGGMNVNANVSTHASCNGSNNGSAMAIATGGTAPYTWSWSNGATTQAVSNLTAGSYTVTATDANGCTAGQTITINQPTVLSLNPSHTPSTCGSSNGSVSVSIAGGMAPYSYSWNTSPVQTTATANNLPAGSYTVQVQDAAGCTQTASTTIPNTGGLNVNASVSAHASCNGSNNGSATAIATGGTAPYTWNWSNGATTQAVGNLAAGSYTVTAIDANGCTAGQTVTVNQPAALDMQVSSQPVTCSGTATGSISVIVSGGTAPYTYTWSNSMSGSSITNIGAGTYTVTVRDQQLCEVDRTVSLGDPTPLFVSASHTNVSCASGSDGAISLIVTGGTAPYSCVWNNGINGLVQNAIPAGSYSYILTDASGCQRQGTIIVSEPSPLAAVSTPHAVTCYGSSTGYIQTAISGGTSPYAVSWNTGATTPLLNHLPAGSYSAVITDAAGCMITVSAIITQPDSLGFTWSATPSACNASTGTVQINTFGGTIPYSFSLDGGMAGFSPLFTGLTAGVHTLIITDGSNCELIRQVVVPSPGNISVQVTNSQPVRCQGQASGSAQAVVSGGLAPFSFSWSTGETGTQATQLTAGTHHITVNDAAGCVATETFTVQQPLPLSAQATITGVSCYGGNNGSISLQIGGGTGNYTIAWENGDITSNTGNLSTGSHRVEIRDANNCLLEESFFVPQPEQPIILQTTVLPGECGSGGGTISVLASGGTAPYDYSWNTAPVQSDPIAGGLQPGSYMVTVTDAMGCEESATAMLPDYPLLSASVDSVRNVSCSGGSDGKVFIRVNGGTAPYQYQWGNGPQAALPDSLRAGTYNLTISDQNGCTAMVNFNIGQPQPLSGTITVQDVSCFGAADGRALASITGGTAPYSYQWSNNAQGAQNNQLTAGTYHCMIRDANGCPVESRNILVAQPEELQVSLAADHPGCNGLSNGSLVVNASGGVQPYQYQWNTGSQASSLHGLGAGTYQVNVIDANGCLRQAESTLQLTASYAISVEGDTAVCYGSQASLTAYSSGTHDRYTYTWNHGVTGKNISVHPLETTTYTVTASDQGGCTASTSFTVTVHPVPQVSITATDTTGCAPLCTRLSAHSPTAVSYNWVVAGHFHFSTASIDPCFNSPGVYPVRIEVKDNNSCSTLYNWDQQIEVYPVPEAAFVPTPREAPIDDPTVRFHNQSKGATSYSYYFGDPNQSSVLLPNPSFTYRDTGYFEVTLEVANEHGCTDQAIQTIHIGGLLAFYLPRAFSPNADGINDVFLPKATGMAPEGFEMRIFNRWGHEIFYSDSWEKGWDGTVNGNPVPVDQYICKIRYYDKAGKGNDHIGSVIVTE